MNQIISGFLPLISALILALFFPAAAYCYRTLRLPRKREEMQNICQALGLSDNYQVCPYGLFKAYDDTTPKDYVLPVLFCSVYSLIALFVLFDPGILAQIIGMPTSQSSLLIYSGRNPTLNPQAIPAPLNPDDLGNLTMILMAALGCYVWSIQYIGRRLNALDLTPGAFFTVATRMVFSSFIALAVRHVLMTTESATVLNMLPAVAFFIGMFPQRGLQFLQEKLGPTFNRGQRTKELPLDMIEGINLFTKTRLAEVDVDNAQNLAEANFVELMLRTPFNPWKILDWIAQAKLYVRIPRAIEELRDQGVRTVFDFLAVTDSDSPGPGHLERTKSLEPETILRLRRAMQEDPGIALLLDMRRRLTARASPTQTEPKEKPLLTDSV
ncbi:MAG: hypothetical protein KKE73_11990 [Proteobacteria bacterium]|nr:hypothetical protein [Pseudomonadota bacterium]